MIRGIGALVAGACLGGACAGPPRPGAADPAEARVAPRVVPRPGAEDRWAREGWRLARTEAGRFVLAWRPVGGRVPRNQPFSVELAVFEGEEPLAGAEIRPRGWMPAHNHGLVRRPTVVELGDGRYRAEGMLLHMRGHWRLSFDVVHQGVGDVATFEVDL